MSSLLARLAAALSLALAISTTPVPAQDGASSGLTLELNKLAPSDKGCLFTFVTGSRLDADIKKFSYEVALFNAEGLVERMTVLDFQDLPAGATRVRQFDLPQTDCDDVSRILINDAAACEGTGIEPDICMGGLTLESRSDVELSN